MRIHFFTAPFYFAFIWFRVQGSRFRVEVAASPQSINRAMPEGSIQVTSHQSLVTPNPQSLIPSYSSLLSNLRALVAALPPFFRRWYSRIAAFPSRGRCPEGADRVTMV